MSEGWAGWGELPASAHLRSVQEILLAPPTVEERRALKREQAEAEAKRANVADAADNSAAAAFMARMNGTQARNPLAAAEPVGRDREAATRRRAAIEVLKAHDLEDVITGQPGTVPILDANMGIVEAPQVSEAQRAELDRRYELQRSEREAEDRCRAVERYREDLDERRRAAGLDRVSYT